LEQQQLAQLIARYNAGTATNEEKAFVEEWYESIQGETPLLDDLQLNKVQQELYAALTEHIGQKTGRELSTNQNGRRRSFIHKRGIIRKPGVIYKRSIIRWAAAAAILLAIGAGLWLYQSKPAQLANDFAPGSSKAVLTLGDGSQLTLDKHVRNGQIAAQGGIIINKNAEGQIVYNAPAGFMPDNGPENVITTPRGGIYAVVLPDGTKVWLNAASALKFPTFFSHNERTVALTGEAYFEVAPDAQKPFRVVCGDTRIEVLGTHFNVSNYPDEPAVTTTLLQGSVRVSANGQSTLLQPGEQSAIDEQQLITVNKGADSSEVLAWKNDQFYFKDAHISTIMRQISRWYDVDVVFDGPLPNDEFSGKISRDVNASQVLKILALSGINFKIEGRKIILK
jgi:transmembrane sensor